MAKKIFLSLKDIEDAFNEAKQKMASFASQLSESILNSKKDGIINVEINVNSKKDHNALLEFTPQAWIKMRALVDSFAGEVQWHGAVERKNKNAFLVKDILVFPHETTSTTVVSEQEEYEKWLNELDDETFNACRFHGHSHVNMGVYPSSVDMEYRYSLVSHMGTPKQNVDLFYVFLITNKKGDISAEIYDLTSNVLYSTNDIAIKVPLDGEDLQTFIKRAKECAIEKPRTPQIPIIKAKPLDIKHDYSPCDLDSYETIYEEGEDIWI